MSNSANGAGQMDQSNKIHRIQRAGVKIDKRKAQRQKKSGDENNNQKNPRAFSVTNIGKAKAKIQRNLDRAHRKEFTSIIKQDEAIPPPKIIAVMGPSKSGKSTLIRSLVKMYSGQNVTDIRGPITVVAGKKRRYTFFECPNDIYAMMDISKIVDLVLLVVDGAYGFEMETFEFLNLLQLHGFPKVIGVLTHMDKYKSNKSLNAVKKQLKQRFWTEIYAGAKMVHFSGIINTKYPKPEVKILTMFINRTKYRPLLWRSDHPYLLVDRIEDTSINPDTESDRDVIFYGYLRGCNMKDSCRVHIAGIGDYDMQSMELIDDPCPLPDESKRSYLRSKEVHLYAPMSNVGGVKFDKDAVYIDLAEVHYTKPDALHITDRGLIEERESVQMNDVDSDEISPADLVRLMQDKTMDDNDDGQQDVKLFSDMAMQDMQFDEELEDDVEGEYHNVGEGHYDEEDDVGEIDQEEEDDGVKYDDDGNDDDVQQYDMAEESDDDAVDDDNDNDDDCNEWMGNRIAVQEPITVDNDLDEELRGIMKLVYGKPKQSKAVRESGKLLKIKHTHLYDDYGHDLDLPDSISCNSKKGHAMKGQGGFGRSNEIKSFLLQDRFVSSFPSLDIVDDHVDDEDDVEDQNDRIDEELRKINAQNKVSLKEKFNRDFDQLKDDGKSLSKLDDNEQPEEEDEDEKAFVSHSLELKREQENRNKNELIAGALSENDAKEKRLLYEGYWQGLYVRIKIAGIPASFIRNFDAHMPVVLGGLMYNEEKFDIMKCRVKRHRWFGSLLKSNDPVIVSLGWRRYQCIPIYAIEDQNKRQRYLKYTPEHTHCHCFIYGPCVPPNTGILAIQSSETRRSDFVSDFRICLTGTVIETGPSFDIVKKLKLVGSPSHIEKNTAFIKGMFNSELEVAKFEGARIRTVSGLRGIIKKSQREGDAGSFRASFEDKILMSDIVTCRLWMPVEVKHFYNPVTSLLQSAASKWRAMRTTRQLRIDYNLPTHFDKDSAYKPIVRPMRRFGTLHIPDKLQESLPFRNKPKSERRVNKTSYLETRKLVIEEPDEKRERSMIQMLSTLKRQSDEARRISEGKRGIEKLKKKEKIAEKFAPLERERRKRKFALEGAQLKRKRLQDGLE